MKARPFILYSSPMISGAQNGSAHEPSFLDFIVARRGAACAPSHPSRGGGPSNVPILITVETGTCKEVIAHAIQLASSRAETKISSK